jgi:hypothetical protein
MERIVTARPGVPRRPVDMEQVHAAGQIQQVVRLRAMPQMNTARSGPARISATGPRLRTQRCDPGHS